MIPGIHLLCVLACVNIRVACTDPMIVRRMLMIRFLSQPVCRNTPSGGSRNAQILNANL